MASRTKQAPVDETGGGVAVADAPEEAPVAQSEPEPRSQGRCGERPCFQRAELQWTGTPAAGRVVNIAVTGKGADLYVAWNMGDGTTLMRRGGFSYTYATAGAKTITPAVQASSVVYGASKSVTAIA